MGILSGSPGKLTLKSAITSITVGTLTASAGTYVMSGVGGTAAYTPVQSGNIMVVFWGKFGNTTTADEVLFKLAYGTGTAPAINAAASGTVISGVYDFTPLTGVLNIPMVMIGFIIGAVINTALWVDIQGQEASAGLRTIAGLSVQFIELPL